MTGEMANAEFVQWFATLGVGGVLAAFMFWFYRKDVKQFTELWKSVTQELISVVKDNTVSNTKLIAVIEAMERRQAQRRATDDKEHGQ